MYTYLTVLHRVTTDLLASFAFQSCSAVFLSHSFSPQSFSSPSLLAVFSPHGFSSFFYPSPVFYSFLRLSFSMHPLPSFSFFHSPLTLSIPRFSCLSFPPSRFLLTLLLSSSIAYSFFHFLFILTSPLFVIHQLSAFSIHSSPHSFSPSLLLSPFFPCLLFPSVFASSSRLPCFFIHPFVCYSSLCLPRFHPIFLFFTPYPPPHSPYCPFFFKCSLSLVSIHPLYGLPPSGSS